MQQREVAFFKPDYYIELALKHRWLIIIPFCLAMIVGIALVFMLPRTYEASTLILVRPQRVPEKYVSSLVSSDIESRISTISQQIMSRTNLEKIINQFNLFSDPGQENMFMEDKIANLRSRVQITVERSKGRRNQNADAFSISFTGTEPELVMRIANGLATFFIDENLKAREAQAVSTGDFLDDELEAMRERLVVVEKRLEDYRKTHMGALPEQLETNLRMLDRLQMQLNEKTGALHDENARIASLGNQIETNRQILAETGASETGDGDTVSIEQLRAQLASMKSSYTDNHPDVIRLKAKIAELEKEGQNGNLKKSGKMTGRASRDPALLTIQKSLAEQVRQRSEAKLAVINLETEISKINRQIKDYQQRVEQTPKHEQELLTLQRDYKNIRESYNSLLNRKLEAEIAVNMEKKQKGEQFSILDPARLPEKPVSPNMRKLFFLVLAAGLLFGAGLVKLLDFFDMSLREPEYFEADLGLPVLATVPRILQPKEMRRRRLNRILTGVSIIVALGLFAGFATLAFKGPEMTIEAVRGLARM